MELQVIVSQVMLPIALACIMFAMGLQLQPRDFSRVARSTKSLVLGLSLQMLLLPLIALVLIYLLQLDSLTAAGLFLVSLCPGGATSNLFTNLAKGDLALSVALTSIVTLLSPLLLPLIFLLFTQWQGQEMAAFSIPLLPAIKKLSIVTLLPILLGMIFRAKFSVWASKQQQRFKLFSLILMSAVIIALVATNYAVLVSSVSVTLLGVLLLSSSTLLIGYYLSALAATSRQQQVTIAYEVGIQNAGTAMFVAYSIMHTPELAHTPLAYGLIMNIPAFILLYWLRRQAK